MNASGRDGYQDINLVPYAGGSEGYDELRINTYEELGTLSHTEGGNGGYLEPDSIEREC